MFSILSCFPPFSLIPHTTLLSETHLAYPVGWSEIGSKIFFLQFQLARYVKRCQYISRTLLRAVVASDAHVLRQFFPPVAKRTYNLRPRKHPFLLPPKDDRYFVSRVLFK